MFSLSDYMDIVADEQSQSPSEESCKPEEDPRAYVSSRSGRGPLKASWRADHKRALELLRAGAPRFPFRSVPLPLFILALQF